MNDSLMTWLNLIVILAGPLLAVWFTRCNDDRRADKSRKMDIFRTLMRTRKMPVHVDHVGALNLVEIEFIGREKVIAAWKAYLANLSEALPPIEKKDEYDQAIRKRDSLLTKLLSEIAQALKIKVEQLDILEGNYIPQGWLNDDWEQRLARRHLIDVLAGRKAICIRTGPTANAQSPYPPPPEVTNKN